MTFWLTKQLLKQTASPLGYVEDCFDMRTLLEGCASSRQVVA